MTKQIRRYVPSNWSLGWKLGAVVALAVSLVGTLSIYREARQVVETLHMLVQQQAEARLLEGISQLRNHVLAESVKRLRFVAESNAMNRYYSLGTAGQIVARLEMERLLSRLQRDNQQIFHSLRFLENDGDEALGVVGSKRLRRLRQFGQPGDDAQLSRLIDQLFRLIKGSSLSQAVALPPYRDKNGAWWLLIGLGVADSEGRTLGSALVLQASLASFLEQMREIDILGTAPAWVLDEDGQVLLQPPLERPRANPVSAPEQAAVVVSAQVALAPGDRPLVHAYLSVPQTPFRAFAAEQVIGTAFAFVAIVLVIFGLTGWLAYRIGAPIAGLASTTRRIASGELEARAPATGSTEIRQLATDFNSMIDQLMEREDALRASATRLSTVVTGAPIVLCSLDRDGRFTLFEGKGLEGMGLKPGEVIGRTAKDVFADRPETEDVVRRALSGETHTTRIPMAGREYLGYFTSLRGANDKFEGAIGVLADITEQVQAEQALHHLNEELELRVEERTQLLQASNRELGETLETLKLAQTELVRREKLASLGSLVAGVAHELGTPFGNSLTMATTLSDSVRTLAEEMDKGPVGHERMQRFLDLSSQGTAVLISSLMRASELIMHFKQVAVDQTSAQRRHFDLAQVVGEIVSTLQPQFKKTPHRIAVEIPSGIDMDSFPGPLGQVITNLTSNSLVHGFDTAHAGLVTIAASMLDDKHVRIRVADNGRGIAPEYLPRIFDPFFTSRLGQGGSGLGLHIVYSITTRVLNGQIQATSEPGNGAHFVIDLPLSAGRSAEGAVERDWMAVDQGALVRRDS